MTSIPPGWYPDQYGVTRWWDGTQWTAATQPAEPAHVEPQPQEPVQAPQPVQPTPVAQPAQGVPQQGYGQAAYAPTAATTTTYPQVAPGTPGTTVWAWIIAVLPVLTLLLNLGYMLSLPAHMRNAFSGLANLDPTSNEFAVQLSNAVLSAVFSGWFVAVVIFGILVFAAIIVLAYFDHRELARRGYVRPFHWAWAFFGSVGGIVYIIGRTVVVHRRGGRALGPLWTMIAVTAAMMIVDWIGGAVLGVQIAQVMNELLGQYGYGYSN